MKSISAAIVVLSGSVVLSVGANVPHGDTQAFTMLAGGGLILIGLFGWWQAMRKAD